MKALKLIAIYQEYASFNRYEELLCSAKLSLPTFNGGASQSLLATTNVVQENNIMEEQKEMGEQAIPQPQPSMDSQIKRSGFEVPDYSLINCQDDLQVSITESKTIQQGWLGATSYTQYRIETKVSYTRMDY